MSTSYLTRSRSRWRRLLPTTLVAALLQGCASAPEPAPWIEGGVERGTIRVSAWERGERHEYLDLRGRLVRLEHRGHTGKLVPSHPIEHREYDDSNRLRHLYFTTIDGQPTRGSHGFAARRSTFERLENGERAVHFDYLDVGERPMSIDGGYSRETLTFSGRRLMHRRFFDPSGQVVGAKLGEWQGVGEVRYAYLKGVTPIVMEMLVGLDGVPINKRKLSGHTRLHIEHWYQGYGRYGTYPVYTGTTAKFSSPQNR